MEGYTYTLNCLIIFLCILLHVSVSLCQPPKVCFRKPVSVKSYNSLFSYLNLTYPCYIAGAEPCGGDLGKLIIGRFDERNNVCLDKKVPFNLLNDATTIGSSDGWVATLNDDGILRLHDDLNPYASESDPKRFSLPPLVTLPGCQTQIVTNVCLSSPCDPEGDDECVVAVKFLGPQVSFCIPGQSNPKWINARIADPSFFSSRLMISYRDNLIRIPGAGGQVIASWNFLKLLWSWDLHEHKYHTPKFQKVRFHNHPEVKNMTRDYYDICDTTQHLVESITTHECFLLKWYRKISKFSNDGSKSKLKTQAVMVFKLDEQGNAVYTNDIGDLVIFLSHSDPFCVRASSYPGLPRNKVCIIDHDELAIVDLDDHDYQGVVSKTIYQGYGAPLCIPPQSIPKAGAS